MIRVVKLSIKYEYITHFSDLFESRKADIRQFEGCTHLELWQDKKNPAIFYTYSHWTHESNLEAYRGSELFQSIWSTVKPWFNHKAEAFSANPLIQL